MPPFNSSASMIFLILLIFGLSHPASQWLTFMLSVRPGLNKVMFDEIFKAPAKTLGQGECVLSLGRSVLWYSRRIRTALSWDVVDSGFASAPPFASLPCSCLKPLPISWQPLYALSSPPSFLLFSSSLPWSMQVMQCTPLARWSDAQSTIVVPPSARPWGKRAPLDLRIPFG